MSRPPISSATTVVAAIGPVTAAAALELGITPDIVADPYTVEGLVQALVQHFSNSSIAK